MEPPPSTHALAQTLDWSATALGARERWPAALSAVISTILDAPIPMGLAYGPDFILVYNDAYASVLGPRFHPMAFGRSARDTFGDYWALHGSELARVLHTGESFYDAETMVPQPRDPGRAPGAFRYSRAYSAVRDHDGGVLGVLIVFTEFNVAERNLAAVARLATALTSAVSVDDVAREALRHAVMEMDADYARIVLADGPSLRMARRAGLDQNDDQALRLPPVWTRLPETSTLPSVEVTRSGVPQWLDSAPISDHPDLASEPAGGGRLHTIATVPLHTGQLRGALALDWESPHDLRATDRSALVMIGNIVGQAIARAQRFDEQRGHSDTLQRSMLPADLPHVPGLAVGARYQPSAPGNTAGGDFYDLFTVDDGRVVLAIGDVVGHGVLATAVMGQVRAALRVLALRSPDPVSILAGLDPFVASLGPDVFVTALVGLLDVTTGVIELSSAGHPCPLAVRCVEGEEVETPRRRAEFADVSPDPPLGIIGLRSTSTIVLDPGDTLLLFTDGLIELPSRDIDIGLEELREVVEHQLTVADPRLLCSLVLDRLGSGDDDIAVVAVTRDDSQRRSARLDLPAESTAPGAARAWVATTLTGWGLDPEMAQNALLATNELVTNALLHARSGTHIELDLDDHRLLVLVSDSGMAATLYQQHADPTAQRGRGLDLVDAITDAWGSERTSRGTTVWFELTRGAS
ncbi:MAG TPA: SpoIIE family protein phosphatase [Nocardioidaceae bacterium]|nr:SpoIIE family protein phosphatase [Nocardioidaceae bacterium]